MYRIARVSLNRCSIIYLADRRSRVEAIRTLLSCDISDDLQVLLADIRAEKTRELTSHRTSSAKVKIYRRESQKGVGQDDLQVS